MNAKTKRTRCGHAAQAAAVDRKRFGAERAARAKAAAKWDAEAFVTRLRPPVLRVWNDIGYESLQLAAECGERLDNEAAMEGCIDANRLTSNAGDAEADAVLTQAIKDYGYDAVMRALCRRIKLI